MHVIYDAAGHWLSKHYDFAPARRRLAWLHDHGTVATLVSYTAETAPGGVTFVPPS